MELKNLSDYSPADAKAITELGKLIEWATNQGYSQSLPSLAGLNQIAGTHLAFKEVVSFLGVRLEIYEAPYETGEPEPAEYPDPVVHLTARERDTILAALRFWQSDGREDVLDIATNNGAHGVMSPEEIDSLCEDKINQ